MAMLTLSMSPYKLSLCSLVALCRAYCVFEYLELHELKLVPEHPSIVPLSPIQVRSLPHRFSSHTLRLIINVNITENKNHTGVHSSVFPH